MEPSQRCLRTDHVFQRTPEIPNVVPQATVLVEHPSAHYSRPCLRRMRDARGRPQGLVFDPSRAGRDGATEDGGIVEEPHEMTVAKGITLKDLSAISSSFAGTLAALANPSPDPVI